MKYNYGKLFLIYKWTILGENDKALLDDMAKDSEVSDKIGFVFRNHNEKEQKLFLRQWATENNIKAANYITILDKKPKCDKYGNPYFCYKIKNVIIN